MVNRITKFKYTRKRRIRRFRERKWQRCAKKDNEKERKRNSEGKTREKGEEKTEKRTKETISQRFEGETIAWEIRTEEETAGFGEGKQTEDFCTAIIDYQDKRHDNGRCLLRWLFLINMSV